LFLAEASANYSDVGCEILQNVLLDFQVIWQMPRHANGEIIRYEVRRNGRLVSVNNGEVTR